MLQQLQEQHNGEIIFEGELKFLLLILQVSNLQKFCEPIVPENAIFYYIKIIEPRRWKIKENHQIWKKS